MSHARSTQIFRLVLFPIFLLGCNPIIINLGIPSTTTGPAAGAATSGLPSPVLYRQVVNIAPLSTLKDEMPGYVDGIVSTSDLTTGCGGGGGPCMNTRTDSSLPVYFDQPYQIDHLLVYFGCNDGETMDGELYNLTGGKHLITPFQSMGCGDTIEFPSSETDQLLLTMTDGGGSDRNISIAEIEIYAITYTQTPPTPTFTATIRPTQTPTRTATAKPAVLQAEFPSGASSAGEKSIWTLAQFEELKTPGRRDYYFEVFLDSVWLWDCNFCATDKLQLSSLISSLSMEFLLNRQPVPIRLIQVTEYVNAGWACQRWTTRLSGWGPGSISDLEIHYIFTKPVYDGKTWYPKGEYRQILHVLTIME